ncbi:MAG: type VI secretion system ImpA family N-terminal domain-containing protein [Deltaproteobacteria bacterium]|nr:type VI secretion system ImpA family N-terminal domain-containing protein [Deltaproteobacteria bacterium]
MIDIELLTHDFPKTDSPGLETFDPRLEEVTTYAQNGDYDALAPILSDILNEKILDVRVLGYYAFVLFHEQGLPGLLPAFAGLARVFAEFWEAMGPAKNREKIATNSIAWFLKVLLKRLQREEKTQGSGWTLWLDTVSSDDAAEILEAAENLRRTLVPALQEQAAGATDHLSKVVDWLGAFERAVYREPEPEVEEDESEVESTGTSSGAGGLKTRLTQVDNPLIEGSIHIRLLMQKMEAFEQLIREEKFARAELIADDINQILANFDPLVYFPKLFATYCRTRAMNSGDLSEFEEAKDSRDWQAMQALYQADLDAFTEF